MMNGKRDRLILPEQAQILFDAACEPKELRWYDGPHWPPGNVVDDVADWVTIQLLSCPASSFVPAGDASSQDLRRAS
jgi:hypothetical protein